MTPLTLTDPASAATGGANTNKRLHLRWPLLPCEAFQLMVILSIFKAPLISAMIDLRQCCFELVVMGQGPTIHPSWGSQLVTTLATSEAENKHPGVDRVILLAPCSVFQSVSYANHKYLISCLWRLNLYNRDQSLESLVHCNILCGYSGPAAKTRDFDIDHFDAAWYQDIGGQPPAQ